MTARVRLAGSAPGTGMQCAPGETLLETLKRLGDAPRIGCRRGGCGVCKVNLVEGAVDYEAVVAASVLTDQERADGVCLSCRAVPRTDVVVSLDWVDTRPNPLLALYRQVLAQQAPGRPATESA